MGPLFNVAEVMKLYLYEYPDGIILQKDAYIDKTPFPEFSLLFRANLDKKIFRVDITHILTRLNYSIFHDGEYLGGFLLDSADQDAPFGRVSFNSEYSAEGESMSDWVRSIVAFCGFAINIMMCKNITYEDYNPNAHPIKPQPEIKMGMVGSFLKYKILHINPISPKTVKRSMDKPEPKNIRPVHAVRGHFMTATEERPLFGKPWGVGTFWVGAYVCGNPQFGMTWNDYHMEIPR